MRMFVIFSVSFGLVIVFSLSRVRFQSFSSLHESNMHDRLHSIPVMLQLHKDTCSPHHTQHPQLDCAADHLARATQGRFPMDSSKCVLQQPRKDHVRVSSKLPVRSVVRCKLPEEEDAPIEWENGGVQLEVTPFRVLTLKLTLQNPNQPPIHPPITPIPVIQPPSPYCLMAHHHFST